MRHLSSDFQGQCNTRVMGGKWCGVASWTRGRTNPSMHTLLSGWQWTAAQQVSWGGLSSWRVPGLSWGAGQWTHQQSGDGFADERDGICEWSQNLLHPPAARAQEMAESWRVRGSPVKVWLVTQPPAALWGLWASLLATATTWSRLGTWRWDVSRSEVRAANLEIFFLKL